MNKLDKIFISLLFAVIAVSCGPKVIIPDNVELGKEYPNPNEAELSKDGIQVIIGRMNTDYTKDQIIPRGFHPKHHGCVSASFTVEGNIPADLKHGIFKTPKTFSSWVRFSNGSPPPKEDKEGDIRGMAIKLIGVDGKKVLESEQNEKTQDFLIINTPALPVGDPVEYLAILKAAMAKKPMSYFFGGVNPFNWKLGAMAKAMGGTTGRKQKVGDMLDLRYWSTTPYLLGASSAVKYSAKPCEPGVAKVPENPEPDYLKKVLVDRLSKKEACFDFMVQKQVDAKKMPVEDPSLEWDEKVSPFVKVATIKIPVQKFDSPAQMKFCENLSFTPWHALPEHRPIGGINRVRKMAYEEISKYRHEKNNAPRNEP